MSRDESKWNGDLRNAGGNLSTERVQLDFSKVRKFRAYEEALADPRVDAVDLCVPTDQHAGYAMRALRGGKHVLVEKPLALTAGDAINVAREAEASGRVLMAAHVLRFIPAYTVARDRIQRLGPVRAAFFRRRCAAPAWSGWLLDPARSGGGAFDLLIHDADYVRWLFGMPLDVAAAGTLDPAQGIDLVTATLRYAGAAVTISGGWHGRSAYPFSMDFTIICEAGTIEFGGGGLTQYRVGAMPELIELPDTDPFAEELAHFHACALSGEPSQVCPVSESVDAVRLMDAIVRKRAA